MQNNNAYLTIKFYVHKDDRPLTLSQHKYSNLDLQKTMYDWVP